LNKTTGFFEPFDSNCIKSGLDPHNLQSLFRLEIFNSITSTNTYLLEQSKINPTSGWVCLAEEQTQGRGRRGRTWYSPKGGNIYCSILWDFLDRDVSALSIAVGVMVIKALQKYHTIEGLRLKWPNDIIFSGRKLGGILLERRATFVVVGIGLNLYLPENNEIELIANSIDLSRITNQKIERNHLTGLLVNELLSGLNLFAQSGVTPFLADWRQCDALIGHQVTVSTPTQNYVGEMKGINEQGELLLLDDQNRMQQFCYGEVTVRVVR
jgi:BirA family biotin operon repressor/biotin-[acetyl-CoA-carboxylase] ligase